MGTTWYGSLQNRLMERGQQVKPEVGMGATEMYYSDRLPYEIVEVRAERRRLEREQKAAAQQEKERVAKTKRGQIMARLERNGITAKDLEDNYHIGYEDGHKTAMNNTIIVAFAAVCVVLHELHGFGQHRLFRILNEMYQKITLTIDTKEIIDEVFEKTGLTIDFDDIFEPVHEVDKK